LHYTGDTAHSGLVSFSHRALVLVSAYNTGLDDSSTASENEFKLSSHDEDILRWLSAARYSNRSSSCE
jgi:hypothetical protein